MMKRTMALNANDTARAWRPSSAIGDVSTANENPNPPRDEHRAWRTHAHLRRFFDRGDRGHGERRVHERARHDLQRVRLRGLARNAEARW